MLKTNKKPRKSKLVPRCETSEMEFVMAEMEQKNNMNNTMITNIKSEDEIKSESQLTNEGYLPKLSIKVEVEPCEEDWHIPTNEEMSASMCLKDTASTSENMELKYESDPEVQMILNEEAKELNKIISNPKNIEVMENLFHNNNKGKKRSPTSKSLLVVSEESSRGLDFESGIGVSLIKKEATEVYENVLKSIADDDERYLYRCDMCHLTWLSNDYFNAHIEEQHPDKDTWKIETVKYSSNRIIITLVHATVSLSNNCPNCNEFFSEKILMTKHMQETFKKCSNCMKLFFGCIQFHDHIPYCHSGIVDCTCDVFVGDMKEREDKHCVCENNGQLKKCVVCQTFFVNNKSLLEHQKRYHVVSSKLKMYVSLNKCMTCKMTYVGRKDLHDCKRKVKKVKCVMCEKLFLSKLLLNIHIKAMTKPNLKCENCNFSYLRECEKYNHMCVKKKIFSLLYRCDICKRTFLEKKDVHRHIQLEHVIHFASVTNYISLTYLYDKKKEIKDVHKQRNIMVTFCNDPTLPKRGTIVNNMIKKNSVPPHLLCISEDQDMKWTDDSIIKTENTNSCESRGIKSEEEPMADKEKSVEQIREPNLMKIFQGTTTYNRFEINNQLSSLVKNQSAEETLTKDKENDVELINAQNECIEIESDEEKLVIDESDTVSQKYTDSANVSKSTNKIKIEKDIETEIEFDMVESESLSDFIQHLPKMAKELNERLGKLKLVKCVNCGLKSTRKLYKNHLNSCPAVKNAKRPSTKRPSFLNNLSSSHTCLLCEKDFTNLSLYFKHFVDHGYETKQCPYCMKVQDGTTFVVHCLTHIKSNFYKCIAINQDKKEETIRTVKCRQCKKNVEEVDYLKHFETHHMKYKPESEIKVQDDRTEVKPKLKEVPLHLFQDVIQVLTQVKMYDRTVLNKHCVICNKKSDRSTEIKRHLIEHLYVDAMVSMVANNGLVCQICSNSYQNSDKYKCHMREHALLPVYECQICNRSFGDSSNFAKHKKVHDIKCLKCDLCARKFTSERMYEQHLALHKRSKLIHCPECEKHFYFESHFKKHYRLTHVRPLFKCRHCKMAYPTLKELWDHLWEVHRLRKVQADCEECGASFRKMQALRAHIAKVHVCTAKKKDAAKPTNEISSPISSTSTAVFD